MFSIEARVVGPFGVSAWLLSCPETREAVYIDPGDEAPRLSALLSARKVTLKAIWLTHAHLDHLGAVNALRQATGAKVCLHRADRALAEHVAMQARLLGLGGEPEAVRADEWLVGGEMLELGHYRLKVLHTPGHTPGGCCFHYASGGGDEVVFTGDTLFAGSVGRSDLPGGDGALLIKSIRAQLLTLDDRVAVYPGHGEATTIGIEREQNPFLGGE